MGLLAVPFLCLTMLIWPVSIDPLFNQFQSLQDKTLESKILALAGRAGIEGGRVYEVNKSVDTKTLNAYVNGFSGSKRIVLWDNAVLLVVAALSMLYLQKKQILNGAYLISKPIG